MVTYILCVDNRGETVLECEKITWTQDLRVQHKQLAGEPVVDESRKPKSQRDLDLFF